ncbi:MAG: TonB-dependent receptor, partial [Clostridiales bacterium]
MISNYKCLLSITILIIAVLQIFSSKAIAQAPEFTVSGFIRDKASGEALPGASVLLFKDSLNLSKPPLRGATSNPHGYYGIPRLQKQSYFLVARSLGYKSFTAILTIKDDLYNIRLDIELQSEDIKLQEVVVKADKETENGISSITVSPEILNQLPSLSGEVDLFRSLQLLPGVTINNELSSGLYVRGGTPDQNLTLVDGVIVYNPSHLGNFASTFNSDALQNVKLIKGAFPAEYGGRLGSVLDVKLRNGSKEKNKLILGAGLINSHLTLEGPLSSSSTYMFS